jgi:dTDP-glucose 4,6-dehydratase
MKIIITGGAGFIGSNFIHYMVKEHPNYELICVDKLTYAGRVSNLSGVLDKISFVKEDISDREAMFSLFERERPDYVVNFAAESHVDRSIDEPEIFLKSNVLGTQVLLDASRKYAVKRFHQISTDEVYGDLPLDRKDLLFTEKSPLKPSSPYSASKASADLLALSYHRTFGLDVTISRCSNNYGPNQHKEKLIPLVIANAREKKPIPVYGTGENVRDWIYVLDHCEAVDLILHNGRAGEIYNVGGSCEKRNIDIIKMILSELNESEELITFVKDRPGHDLRYAIDSTKIKNELGWTPKTDFSDGLKKTIEHYDIRE